MTITGMAGMMLGIGTVVLAGCGGHGSDKHAATLPAPKAPMADAGVAKAPEPKPAPAPVVKETWACTVVLPASLSTLAVYFEHKGDAWSATADIMGTTMKALPLTAVTHGPEALAFTLTLPGSPPQVFALTRAADAAEATGNLGIATQQFYTKMIRLAEGEAMRPAVGRPQTPKPPYPYGEREVVVDAPEAGKLAGTLTIPTGTGPFPAVLLISGSGQQDRDENIYGHRSFRIIADKLTRAGLAVLRLDDRATGKTVGALNSLDTDINDAQAAFEFLLKQPEVDPKRAGLIGHSVGGAIAPIVAVRTKKVAFIVSLAGTVLPGSELVPLQIEADLTARGAPPEVIKQMVDNQRTMAAAMVKGDPVALRKTAAAVIADVIKKGGGPAPSPAELDQMVEAKMKEMTAPWVVTYFKTDPRVSWRKVKSPVLVVIGSKDTQVPAKANLPAITAALKQAKNKDVTAREIPGLNHLFQHADKGVLEEYPMIEESFDPQTLEDITTWLVARAKIKP